MKKNFILIALLGLVVTSCDKNFEPINRGQDIGGVNTGENNENNSNNDVYWGDNAAYHLWFNLLDKSGNNIIEQKEDAIYEIEIIYDGVKYKYDDKADTRASSFKPLAIRRAPLSSSTFGFGDFAAGSQSVFTITFKDNKWDVEQQSKLNPQDKNGELIYNVKINDVEQHSKGTFDLIIE